MAEKKENSELLPQIEPYIARANAEWGEVALLVGASIAVAVAFFFVFRFFRRKDPNTIARSRSSESHGSSSGSVFMASGSKQGKRRRRHSRGPSYEQRNPTRAEVGGLPPARYGEEPPPPAREFGAVPPPEKPTS
jgi:hypothetical protein